MKREEKPLCRQCGKPLKNWWGYHPRRLIGLGYEGNGKFCTVRCGYHWAIGVRQPGALLFREVRKK